MSTVCTVAIDVEITDEERHLLGRVLAARRHGPRQHNPYANRAEIKAWAREVLAAELKRLGSRPLSRPEP
jgi:Xaa-Pro aminopeptidase